MIVRARDAKRHLPGVPPRPGGGVPLKAPPGGVVPKERNETENK